jgi:hypothetical protein
VLSATAGIAEETEFRYDLSSLESARTDESEKKECARQFSLRSGRTCG